MKTTEWDKDTTLVNETINLPRRSMKAVVLLFKSKTPSGSEEYVYPNIEGVKVTIEGVPNSIYSQGIPKSRFHEEAGRLFGRYHNCEKTVPIREFYKDQFACVIDLRTYEDSNVFGIGRSWLIRKVVCCWKLRSLRRQLMSCVKSLLSAMES